ncbi:M48 family metallopeptidase [Burkholderia alba]|uniref:M48 family metallopeptidase n=1 Tax=Burkholderia alba TaxID=2683677 RepID=UPI002B058580|nr:M48 family metallopeptidase [Burkholderia alba]
MPAKLRRAACAALAGVALCAAGPARSAGDSGAAPTTAANTAVPATAAAPATGSGGAQSYPSTEQQVRYGNAIAFRSLIPSALLEQVTANEYHQLLQGAAQGNRLLPANNARVKRLRTMVAKLAPYAVKWNDRVRGWNWEVNVTRSRAIRATCLPGGKVLIDSGLLDRLRLNDDELGVLLAHEIAHALREHARASMSDPQTTPVGTNPLPSLFGLAEPMPAPVNVGERLASLRYGPTDETEADVIGGDIAARAGFDPRAAITLWDKLAAATRADKETGFIYTHPYDGRRRQDLLKRLGDLMPLYAKAVGKNLDALPNYAGISAKRRRLVGR